MKKIIALALVTVFLAGVLAGCTKGHGVVCKTDSLIVERDGRCLIVRDLAGGKTYTMQTVRVKKSEAGKPKTLVETDTLVISTEGGCTSIKTADGVTVTLKKQH